MAEAAKKPTKSKAKANATFLFTAIDAIGTMNPMIELAKCLKARGHTIIFIAISDFKKQLEKCGFTYVAKTADPNAKNVADFIDASGLLIAENSLESLKLVNEKKIAAQIISGHIEREKDLLKKCLEDYEVDVIVLNSTLGSVDALDSGKLWVGVYCESPLDIYRFCGTNETSQQLPPYMSGFKTVGDNDPNLSDFEIQKKLYDKTLRDILNKCEDSGVSHITEKMPSFKVSNDLNLYCYPKELDYANDKVKLIEKTWFRVDSFFCGKSSSALSTELKDFMKTGDGKLIYVSMGTIGSLNVAFMNKLVEALSKFPHRFIVSKGERHDKINTSYDNMHGERYLPQTEILPKVKLFITHGGNNSVSEAFYFGKPMIVYPFMIDQFDNAQRIDETGFGKRLDAQKFDENALKQAIDDLLADKRDEGCAKKMEKASDRIRSEKRLNSAVDEIEKLLK